MGVRDDYNSWMNGWMDREDGVYIKAEISGVDKGTEVTMEGREVK